MSNGFSNRYGLEGACINTKDREIYAYAFSKNFVCWYAQKSAFDLGLKGIRVVSLSPGLIGTSMGNLEK